MIDDRGFNSRNSTIVNCLLERWCYNIYIECWSTDRQNEENKMSTALKPTTNFTLTSFRKITELDICLQVTNKDEIFPPKFIHVNKQDAKELAIALMEFALDEREELD